MFQQHLLLKAVRRPVVCQKIEWPKMNEFIFNVFEPSEQNIHTDNNKVDLSIVLFNLDLIRGAEIISFSDFS